MGYKKKMNLDQWSCRYHIKDSYVGYHIKDGSVGYHIKGCNMIGDM